ISPAEALALKRMGGAGTINPRTGLRQFWEDGGGAGNSAVHADPGHQGGASGGGNPGGNGGYDGQGRGWSGPGGGTMSGPYGGPLGGEASGGSQLGSAGAYKTTGGLNINPGRIAGGLLGSALGPLGSALGALAGGW